MNYSAMRWAVEECQLDGAAKPILFVIAYRADRDTGECWAGQRRIAREAGVTRTHVQRVEAKLIRLGILEVVEQGSGTRPRIIRIAPGLVEGEASASGVVEGVASASGIVEGEVIHSASQWPHEVATNPFANSLAVTFGTFSGHIEATRNELVATSRDDSGHSHVPLSSENAEKGLIKVL
jgi:Helix-turn-helix domain